uniref:Uncharacterized protein n=1 Tax=Tanacetum cinerariifolium TaxID=118510 RepID=A0A6L2NH45_TANCI|nr:hypothetical protein [Tanacetum cinerariifolium]
MLDNSTIDEYAAKLSGIASKSATLGKVMSEHKLAKKFLTTLPRRFVHIVTALEQVLDLKTTMFDDVVGRLKAYEERFKDEEDKANDLQENLLYARTEYSNGNNDLSEGRGRGSYSRGRGRGRGQGRGRDNSQNQGQRDSLKNCEDNEQKGKQHDKRDLSHIQCYRCDLYGHFVSKCSERNRNHEVNLNETQEKGTFFMMNHIQEMIFTNEEKYPLPKSESNTDDEDDVWYFDNGASNHMTSNYSYFSELNENITERVKFGDGSCMSIKGKGSILFQDKNDEHKLLKDVSYISTLRSNVISLGQATISGYDISIRCDFLTMRDSWGSLRINVPRSANRLYKTQLKVGKEYTNEVGESKEDKYRIDDMPILIARLKTIQLLIARAVRRGWKIHHLDVKTAFLNGTSLDCINEFKRRMTSQFEMSDLGELTYYLGIEVSQGKDCVEIKKERYARKILKEVGMEDCNSTSYPMEKDLKLSKAKDEPKVKATQYQKVVGCLRYLLHTRPDLTYSVGVVSRYMQNPRESHAYVIKKILRYLKGTTSFDIKYNRSNYMKLVGYSDSSHNVDIDDRRNTTGHVVYLGTSPITWCLQKQTTVALSLSEVEFMAAIVAACQAIWLRELLAEVTGLKRQKRESKSKTVNEVLAAHKVQGDEIVTWCTRVVLFDSEIQGVIVKELSEFGYGFEAGQKAADTPVVRILS